MVVPVTSWPPPQGDALTVFTRNAALLATSMPAEAVRLCIVPLLVRAADQGATPPPLHSASPPVFARIEDCQRNSRSLHVRRSSSWTRAAAGVATPFPCIVTSVAVLLWYTFISWPVPDAGG